MHLPVVSNKTDKHSLEQKLGPALEFAQRQLGIGRRLLILCESGESGQQLLPGAPCPSVCWLQAWLLLEERLQVSISNGRRRLLPRGFDNSVGKACQLKLCFECRHEHLYLRSCCCSAGRPSCWRRHHAT